MSENTLTLNGKAVAFQPAQTILEVARDNGIHIPTLCHLKGFPADRIMPDLCRGGQRGANTHGCVLHAGIAGAGSPYGHGGHPQDAENDRGISRIQRAIITALTCEANGDCPPSGSRLPVRHHDVPFAPPPAFYATEADNPFIVRDFSRCILCGRCVQACNDVVVNGAIDLGYRGSLSKVVTGGDAPYHLSDCVFCGQCLEVCPTGALTAKKGKWQGRPWETKTVRTTCPYCGVGCQQLLHVRDGRIARVTAVEDAMPNQGRLCVKGRFAYDFIYSEDRLTAPLIRKEDGAFREASWDEALDLVAGKFKEIMTQHGPDAIAGVSCARSTNEDSYQMQKLFRAVIGTNNIDHCART